MDQQVKTVFQEMLDLLVLKDHRAQVEKQDAMEIRETEEYQELTEGKDKRAEVERMAEMELRVPMETQEVLEYEEPPAIEEGVVTEDKQETQELLDQVVFAVRKD